MIDRSQILGQTYQIPQVQPQPFEQQAPLNDGIEPLQGIQYVKGVTEDYYKKVAALKSFMQDAYTNYGVDVRVPDASKPESIKLNSVFRTALADIMSQGNLLKNSQGMYSQLINQGAQFFSDPTKQAVGSMTPQQDFALGRLEPIVTEANDLMQQAHYAGAYDKAVQIYDEKKKYYDQKIQDEPEKAKYYTYQKAGLVPPRQGIKEFAPSSADRRYGRQVSAAGEWIKKITNLQEGAHNSYEPDPNKLTPSGKPYLVSKEFQNQQVGDRSVVEWQFDPDTKETFVVYRDKNGNLSRDNAKQNSPDVLAGQLGRMPSEALIEAAEKNRWYDEFQQINRHRVLGKDYDQLLARNSAKSNDIYEKNVKGATRDLKAALSNIKSRGMFTDDDRLQVGKFKIVKRKGNIWEIENIQEALPGDPKRMQGIWKDKSKWDDLNSLMKFLTSQGAHIEFYNQNLPQSETIPSGTNSATTAQTDNNDPLGIRN